MRIDNVFLDSQSQITFVANIAPAATAAQSAVEQAFTLPAGIPALRAGDGVDATGPGSGNNVVVGGARINATGQMVIQFCNPTAGALTHATGNFTFVVNRP